MRLPTKSGFAVATILAAAFGFTSLTQAAPIVGLAAAVPAMQMTQVQMAQEPSAAEAPEMTHHDKMMHGKMMHGKMMHHHHHHHHHHGMKHAM